MSNRTTTIASATVFVFIVCFSLAYLQLLKNLNAPYAVDGIYFQRFSSDAMMQTLPIARLKEHPFQALWYLHKQRPLLDLIRVLAATPFAPDEHLLKNVDTLLFGIWAFIYACLNGMVYVWVRQFTNHVFGILAALIWAFHPASVYYATYLDNTLLTSLLVFCFFYEIWRASRELFSPARLFLISAALFLLRGQFHWLFFLIVIACLVLFRAGAKKILIFAIVLFSVMGMFSFKQQALFGIQQDTFSGYHWCGMIWHAPDPEELRSAKEGITHVYPRAADPVTQDRFNHREQWEDCIAYTAIFKKEIGRNPAASLEQLLRSVRQNFEVFLRPSSSYSQNHFVHRLAFSLKQKNGYDRVFSGAALLALVGSACVLWGAGFVTRRPLGTHEAARAAGLFLPFAYIFSTLMLANRYEWTESDRLKYLLEPVFFVFVLSQWSGLLISWLRRRSAIHAGETTLIRGNKPIVPGKQIK